VGDELGEVEMLGDSEETKEGEIDGKVVGLLVMEGLRERCVLGDSLKCNEGFILGNVVDMILGNSL